MSKDKRQYCRQKEGTKVFGFSYQGESSTFVGPYDTREEAAEDAFMLNDEDFCYTCEFVEREINKSDNILDASEVVKAIKEYYKNDHINEDCLNNLRAADLQKLSNNLHRTIACWLVKYNLHPNSLKAVNVEMHEAKDFVK